MSNKSFCTCPVLDCPDHPQKHSNECTPCIKKNLDNHEIPACFWRKIGDTENTKSNYTFQKFAESVLNKEGSSCNSKTQ